LIGGGVLGLALVVALAGPGIARAPCSVDPAVGVTSAALERATVEQRDAFLRERIATGARHARAWSLGWGLAYVLASATQLAITPAVDRGTRIDLYVGAASSGFGALVRAVSIPRVIREHRRLRRRPGPEPGACESVHALERALARSARWERRGRAVFMSLGAIVYNVGVGLVLGLAFDRPVQGIRQAAIGSTVGQIMLLTQPTTSVKALDGYGRGRVVPALSTTPMVLPRGAGIAIAARF
jgi:hypothetical protein